MLTIEAETTAAVWEHSIRHILRHANNLLDSEVGGPFYEFRNVILCVLSPSADPRISRHYAFQDLVESFDITRQTSSLEARSIYERMRHWPGRENSSVDQLEMAITALRRNQHSRRAVITLWDPEVDPNDQNPICPCYLQFITRPGRHSNTMLEATAIVRSSDAWMGAMLDIYAFTKLQAAIATQTEMDIGVYVHHVISYHIYQQDFTAASMAMGGN